MADTIDATGSAPVAAPTEPQTTPEAAKPATDPRMEAFARKERQLRRMQQELAAEKQRLTKQAEEYNTGYIPKSRIKEDFWGVLSDSGLDQASIIEQLTNQPNMNDPATRALMNKIKQLEDKQNAAERAAQEGIQRQYQQAVKQIGAEVKMLVDSDPAFETVKEAGMQEAVVELIEQTFNSTGVLMDIADAASKVESHLLLEAEKMSKYKKLQKLKTEQQTQAPEQQTQPNKQIKTLTHAVQAQPTKRLSEKERIARAMAAFHGNKG